MNSKTRPKTWQLGLFLMCMLIGITQVIVSAANFLFYP